MWALKKEDFDPPCYVIIDHAKCSVDECLDALNYFNEWTVALFSSCASVDAYDIYDKALLQDLYKGVFGEPLRDELLQLAADPDLEVNHPHEDVNKLAVFLLLVGLIMSAFGGARKGPKGGPDCVPHSFQVKNIIRFLRSLKHGINGPNPADCALMESLAQPCEWDYSEIKPESGKSPNAIDFNLGEWISRPGLQSGSWDHMKSRVLTVLLFCTSPETRRQIGIEDVFTGPNANLLKLGNQYGDVDNIIANVIGVGDEELNYPKPGSLPTLQGPLDELTARNMLSGPFKLSPTTEISQHLMFTGSHTQSTIYLLHFQSIMDLYSPLTGDMTRSSHLTFFILPTRFARRPTLFKELFFTYALFFLRDSRSGKIGGKFGLNSKSLRDVLLKEFLNVTDSQRIIIWHTKSSAEAFDFRLEDFNIYAKRLEYIQRKMRLWHPQTLQELAIRPYKDPLTYYAFWFAGFFGIASIILVFLGIIQTYTAFELIKLTQ